MEKKFLYHFFEGFVGCPAQESYNLSIKARTSFFLPILRQNMLISKFFWTILLYCSINGPYELQTGISLIDEFTRHGQVPYKQVPNRQVLNGQGPVVLHYWQFQNGQVLNGQAWLGILGNFHQKFCSNDEILLGTWLMPRQTYPPNLNLPTYDIGKKLRFQDRDSCS